VAIICYQPQKATEKLEGVLLSIVACAEQAEEVVKTWLERILLTLLHGQVIPSRARARAK
jgi:hypothetical protein